MESKGWWTPELVQKALSHPAKKYKYLITDDKNEFIASMEEVAINHHKKYGDNLRYLEDLTKIQMLKDGMEPANIFDWLRDK